MKPRRDLTIVIAAIALAFLIHLLAGCVPISADPDADAAPDSMDAPHFTVQADSALVCSGWEYRRFEFLHPSDTLRVYECEVRRAE